MLIILLSVIALLPIAAQRKDSIPQRNYTIHINQYEFDPLQRMPFINDSLLLSGTSLRDSFYQLIQFTQPLNRKQMELLKSSFRLKLTKYFSNYTYLEKLSTVQLTGLRQLPYFRWAGNYEPAYKLSREIGHRTDKDSADERLNEKIIHLHADAIMQQVRQELERLTILVLNVWDNPILGIKRLKVRVTDNNRLIAIARLEEVSFIEEFGRPNQRNQSASWIMQTNVNNSRTIYDHGLRGEGQIIGHIDGAPDINHCFFEDATNNTPGPMHRKFVGYHRSGGIPTTFDDHGTHTAGTAAGQDMISAGAISNQRRGEDGHAFRSRMSHFTLDDINGSGTDASNLREAFETMYADGATVFTNSWGDDNTTDYTTWCEDIDQFSWDHQDALVVFAVSNLADLKTPENAKNCLAVAQSGDTPNQNNSDGGNGPTADGRRKPEITAPGIGIMSADITANCATVGKSGTSMAAPAISAYAAVARQYYIDGWYPSGVKRPDNGFIPSGALLKATLLNGTVDMTGTDETGSSLAGYPTTMEGWGRLLLQNSLYFKNDPLNLFVWDVLHENGLATSESHNYTIRVSTNGQPLKITLVWTEPPGAVSSSSPVVNDLNLIVTSPNGTVFRGNDFTTGQSTANGTITDIINNVEMVLVTTPQAGEYTIQIEGANVSVGNPGQGYAIVATADTEEPPITTGDQNTLVVKARISDVLGNAAAPQLTVQNLMTNAVNYISEVSYGNTTIIPEYAEVSLSQPQLFYKHASRNLLIEMAQETIDLLIANNANVFTKGTADPADDIDRMIIILNDNSFIGDWATTGGWPYDLPGGLTRRISVSVNSIFNEPDKNIAHSLCHQLGLEDLYAHPNVVFSQPHADMWDVMGNVVKSQPTGWSKERATWMTTHDPNSIEFIPRPAIGTPISNRVIPINFLQSTITDNKKVIAIGLSPGVTNINDESVFYFIEARTNTAGSDVVLPEAGVLLYYVNDNIRQGEGPLRIIDDNVATTDLSDAALEVGDSKTPGGTGLTVTVQSATGTEAFRIRIDYDPPATDNDVHILAGDPHWTSPDIWIDSQKDGFDEDMGRTPQDRGDKPVTGEVNRVYFTIHNPGPGDAFDFMVFVRVSEPYHTVGDDADFNTFVGQKFITQLAAGADMTTFVEWTPLDDGEPHSCINVEIPNVFNDVNTYNNVAQQNVQEVRSSRSSPYETVVYKFGITNPYDYYQLFYFKTEGVPQGWTATLSSPKVLLSAKERAEATLTLQPPDNAPPCTEHRISVTSWMPRGNTLVQYGGGTVQVDLRNRTDLSANTSIQSCKRDGKLLLAQPVYTPNAECIVINVQGCTNPVRAFEEIIVRYEDPAGNPVYHTVTTDQFGCYSDSYVVTEGGNWQVTAEYPGNDCSGGVTTGIVDVGIPIRPGSGNPQTTDTSGRRKFWYSFHVGSTHPLGKSDDLAGPNIHLALDITYRLTEKLNAKLWAGINQMTSESTGPNPRWYNFSVNAQRIFPVTRFFYPYLQAGPGIYQLKNGGSYAGFNVGAGGQIPINGSFNLMFGTDYHLVLRKDPKVRFITFHIGVLF